MKSATYQKIVPLASEKIVMAKIRLTKIFYFESAHALYGYDGKCRNIHGHSYQLQVTVFGEPIDNISHAKNGMVMDFGELKDIVNHTIVDDFDHALLLNKNTPHALLADNLKDFSDRVILVNYQPTCENLLTDFAKRIAEKLPAHIQLYSLRLYETATSYAEWMANDQV